MRKRPSHAAPRSANGTSDKYQRILDAAIEVIAGHGFFHSRVAEIADRAGVADGTIYLYFKNKDELLMAAIDSAFHRFIQRARSSLDQVPDPREKLRRMAYLHLEALARTVVWPSFSKPSYGTAPSFWGSSPTICWWNISI